MARTPSPSSEPATWVLVPAVTSFDFLEGSFARSERSRLGGLIGAGLSIVALAGTLAFGGITAVGKEMVDNDLASTQAELLRVNSDLAVLDQAEGIPTAQIQSHISSRTSAITAAVGDELDTVRLLRDLWAGAPAGVSITGVTFAGTGEAAAEGAAAGITVTATASSFVLLADWSRALAATPGLTGVDMTWSGGGSSVAVIVTADLTEQALSARSTSAASAAAAGTVTGAAPAAGQGVTSAPTQNRPPGRGGATNGSGSSQVGTGDASDPSALLNQLNGGN